MRMYTSECITYSIFISIIKYLNLTWELRIIMKLSTFVIVIS